MRAVLDLNVLVAALLSPQGTPAKIFLAWLAGGFDLVISPKLTEELERVLAYPRIQKRISKDDAEEFTELLLRLASKANDPTGLPSVRSSDPDDDYLLALGEAESAALVSGDSDVLQINGGLPLYAPKKFLELIEH